MRKELKHTLLVMILLVIGVITVHAATQNIIVNKSYSIASGGATTWVNKTASYDNAWAGIEPTSITSGTKKTKVVVQKNVSGTLTNKKEKIIDISTSVSTYNNIGSVGKGTWVISNYALNGSTDYAGWSGAFTLNSLS